MKFLGHVVFEKCILVDPVKKKVVLEWERPKNITGIRGLIGLAGYYCHFEHDFSRIATPLIRLSLFGMMNVKLLSWN